MLSRQPPHNVFYRELSSLQGTDTLSLVKTQIAINLECSFWIVSREWPSTSNFPKWGCSEERTGFYTRFLSTLIKLWGISYFLKKEIFRKYWHIISYLASFTKYSLTGSKFCSSFPSLHRNNDSHYLTAIYYEWFHFFFTLPLELIWN